MCREGTVQAQAGNSSGAVTLTGGSQASRQLTDPDGRHVPEHTGGVLETLTGLTFFSIRVSVVMLF